MRITESQIRRIVREAILSESPRRKTASGKPIMYLVQYGTWWAVSPEQWPALLAAGMSGNVNLDEFATRLKKVPKDVTVYRDPDRSVNYSSVIPIYKPLDFGPDDWEYLDTTISKQ